MAIGPRLDLRQSQTLVMTPQLRQAIKLLQYSNHEVAAFVEEELERNPLLERDERPEAILTEAAAPDQRAMPNGHGQDSADHARSDIMPDPASAPLDAEGAELFDGGGPADGGPLWSATAEVGRGGGREFDPEDRGVEGFAQARPSLREHLGEQLRLTFADPVERMIGAHLIALLCPAGRLTAAPEAIAEAMAIEPARVEAVRTRMMRFDPVGLFALDLRECLAAQLAELNRLDPAMQTLLDNLDLLGQRDMRRLMQICAVDAEDLTEMVAEIRRLDPKPAANYDDAAPMLLVPDVLMRPLPDGSWVLELNPDTLPRLLINQAFYSRVAPQAGREDRTFLTERLQTANWLVKSLEQRAQTILKVATEIVRQQDGFFRHGIGHLRPLVLRDIAAMVEMHESTISRVTANKYMATPRGTFELKYFFTTAIAGTSGETHSAETVRHRIRALIDAEAPDGVLSDDDIVGSLRREGVDIARRTVAKYREALRIPSSVQRKREKVVPT